MKGTDMEIQTPFSDVKALKKHFQPSVMNGYFQVLTDEERPVIVDDVLEALKGITTGITRNTILFIYLGLHGTNTTQGPVLLTHSQQGLLSEPSSRYGMIDGSTIRDALVRPVQESGAFCFVHLDACHFSGEALGFTDRRTVLSVPTLKHLSDRTNATSPTRLRLRKRRSLSSAALPIPKRARIGVNTMHAQVVTFPSPSPATTGHGIATSLRGKVICLSACSGANQRSYASPINSATATTILVDILREAQEECRIVHLRELFAEFRERMLDRMAKAVFKKRFRLLSEKRQTCLTTLQCPAQISASSDLDKILDKPIPF